MLEYAGPRIASIIVGVKTRVKNLSVLELSADNDELHLQTWHLRADSGLVLRSQSVFMIKD